MHDENRFEIRYFLLTICNNSQLHNFEQKIKVMQSRFQVVETNFVIVFVKLHFQRSLDFCDDY